MKKWGCAAICQIVIFSVVLFLPRTGRAFGYNATKKFDEAHITLPAPDSVQTQRYLGLPAMKPFTVGQIKAKVVVIEFMSALCEFCSLSAGTMNTIYRTVQENPQLAPNVKVIAVGVASTNSQLEAFKKQHSISYPVLNDANGAIAYAMGNLPTPTTLIVSTRTGKALYSHVGLIWSSDGFVEEIEKQLKKS